MSTTPQDQFIQATPKEVLVIRGAINVLRELAAAPGVEPQVAVPLDSGRERIYEQVLGELENELEGIEPLRRAGMFKGTFRVGFTPAGAQAVRDAAGVLSTLLQDPGGRGLLAEIGFLPNPHSPVSPAEIDLLEDIADRLEPTGVRPGAEREPGEIIDASLSLEGVIANAGDEIANVEEPWPGEEQATFILDDVVRAFSGGETTLPCESALKSLVQVTKLAVAGGRRLETPAIDDPQAYRELIDDAYAATMSVVEAKHCVGRNGQNTLWDRIEAILAWLSPGGRTGPHLTDRAQQLLVDLRAVAEPAVDFTGGPDPLERAGQAQRDIRIGNEDPDDVVAELRHYEDQLSGDLTCDEVFVALIDATNAAIHLDTRAGANAVQNVSTWLEDVYDSVHNALIDGQCLTDEDDLDRFDTLARQVAQSIGGDPRGFARTLYNWVEEVLEQGTGIRAVEAADENARIRLEQLRAELPDVLDFTMTEETVQDGVLAALPPSTATCEQLLVSLGELAQLTAQVVATTGVAADTDLLTPVNRARRQVLAKMGFGGVVVADPIPGPERDCLPQSTLSELRSAMVSIYDPLPDDPDDVQTRAENALDAMLAAIGRLRP